MYFSSLGSPDRNRQGLFANQTKATDGVEDSSATDLLLTELAINITERADLLQKTELDEFVLSMLFRYVLRSYTEVLPELFESLLRNFSLMRQVIKDTTTGPDGLAAVKTPAMKQPMFGDPKKEPSDLESPEHVLKTLYRFGRDRAQYNLQEVRQLKTMMHQLTQFFQHIEGEWRI